MKSTLCHRVKHSFIIRAKDTNNQHSVKLLNQVESQPVCFVWQIRKRLLILRSQHYSKMKIQLPNHCVLQFVQSNWASCTIWTQTERVYGKKSRQMLTSDSQQFMCLESRAEQNEFLPDGRLRLFIRVHEHQRRSITVKSADKSGVLFQT